MFQIGDVLTHYEVTAVLPRVLDGDQYRAVQRKTGIDVILWAFGAKVFGDANARQEYVHRQARTYNVRHPNAMLLTDIFQHEGHVVLVAPFLAAPSLGEMLRRRKLPRAEAWLIFEQVASAVSQYHRNDLVVGDLIPELVRVNDEGSTLCSFGTGPLMPRKSLLAAMTRAGRLRWLAPEVRLGRPFDSRTDLYSLACLAHRVLYGREHPFSDGVRRGGFGGVGNWLHAGGRPSKGPASERWPRIDKLLSEALSGYLIDRPFDVETFVDSLRDALAASPLRASELAAVPPAPPPPSSAAQFSSPPSYSGYAPPTASNPSARTQQPPAMAPPSARTVSGAQQVVPASPPQPRTMMATPTPAPTYDEPKPTMMASAPYTPPAPVVAHDEPKPTMMASAPYTPPAPVVAHDEPKPTMMASAPYVPPAPAVSHDEPKPTMMAAPAPTTSGPTQQRTMAMSAPTPDMLASLAPKLPSAPPRSTSPPVAPPRAAPPQAAPPPAAPPPSAPPAYSAPVVKAPEGANATRPVDVSAIADLLRASSSDSTSPNEKRTAEIDANEVNRLLGEMKKKE